MNNLNNDSHTTMTTDQDDDGHGLFQTFKSSDDIQASLVNNNNDNNHTGWPNDLQGLPPMPVTKRMDYLVWWDYFMSIAYIVSLRSKDPNTQVGACIVNEENRIVGLGYNGMPNNCSDDKLPWSRQSMDPMQTKYLYVCHAEMNAILNKNSYDCKNCTIFVLLFPCNECAKMIIQAGIDRVVYLCDKYSNDCKFKASRYLLEMAKVELIHYKPKQRKIVIDFDKFL